MEDYLMRSPRLFAAVAALFLAVLPARADQVLGQARITSTNRIVLPGGPTLGLWQNGKYIATPDAIQIGGAALNDISALNVTPSGGSATALSMVLANAPAISGTGVISFLNGPLALGQWVTNPTASTGGPAMQLILTPQKILALDPHRGPYDYSFTGEGAVIEARNNPAITANKIVGAAFCDCPDPVARDMIRGVAYNPPGTTLDLVNGVGAYVWNANPHPAGSPFPVSVGQFSVAVSAVDYAKTWARNAVATDNDKLVPSNGIGRVIYGDEIDMNFTSPLSTGGAIMISGSSKVQPTNVTGITLTSLDNIGGTTARWAAFLYSLAGSTNVFAHIGEAISPPDPNNPNPSPGQYLQFAYRRSDGAAQQISLQAQVGGTMNWTSSDPAFQNVIHGGVQVYTFPSASQQTALNAALFGTSGMANQPSQAIDLNYTNSGGGAQFARLSAAGGDIGLVKLITNAGPSWLETVSGFRVNGATGVTCSGAPTSSFAVTGGIVTHC